MDKRKHPRIPLDADGWHAEIKNQLDGSPIGQVVNLSLGGMLIIGTKIMPAETLYQIELTASTPDGDTESFNAGVMILWSAEAESPDTVWAGVQIIDIGEEEKSRLEALAARASAALSD